MRGMIERVTWPLRKLVWVVEERVIWPISDAIHRTPRRRAVRSRGDDTELAAPPTELTATTPELANPPSASSEVEFPSAPSELLSPPADGPAAETAGAAATGLTAPEFPTAPSEVRGAASSATVTEAAAAPVSPSRRLPSLPSLKSRLGSPARDVSIVLGTVAVAIGVGIGAATLIGADGGNGGANPERAAATPAVPAQAPVAGADSGPATLQGVAPDFNAAANGNAAAANTSAADTVNGGEQVSPTAATNSKPSAIPPGVAENISAMNTARDFAGAFVLYEVGETNAKVKKIFARTATPALARALQDRPPRLPDSVQVPTAKVQNVVLGTERGRELEASVSLLRLGDLSELRLTLSKRQDSWAVSEVRG
jgi:hypothetical protein